MKKLFLFAVCGVLFFTSCNDQEIEQTNKAQATDLSIKVPEVLLKRPNFPNGRMETDIVETLNSTLFKNSNFKVAEVHVCKLADTDEVKSVETVDQQFQSTLAQRWVPKDARRNWNGDNDLEDIDWLSFTPFATANESIDAEPIYEAMYNKWETETGCNTLDIDRTPYDLSMGTPSLIVSIDGLAQNEKPLADVSVLGFLPASIFNSIFGSPNVLGVAFTFVFVDPETGEPTKTTRGKSDKYYTEVWFNDGFTWALGPKPGSIDIESVVLHEFGHTLTLGHFGILQKFTNEDGSAKFEYQPVNTMNARYIGQSRNFLGENDKGNFCEAWGSWPWN